MSKPKEKAELPPQEQSGWLKRKKNGIFVSWQPCYCDLKGVDLRIRKSNTSPDLLDSVRITSSSEITIQSQDRAYRFVIKSPDTPDCVMQADDEDTLLSWILALRAATYQETTYSMSQFTIVCVLGRGYYGKVMLCESKSTKERFAIKAVRKSVLLKAKKVHTVIRERHILERANSPFVVRLRFAFQSPAKFYLGLEYVQGGDLFRRLMESDGRLDAADARLYIAEIAFALDYVHGVGVVYRDLKPENVLICADGHLKLTDFGLAKSVDADETTTTFCGTPEYVAPEMIRREHYSFPIDWWALGILAFEILFGSAPFASSNRVRLYQMVLNCEPEYPRGADAVAVDFVGKLLSKNPKTRGCLQTLRAHPFWNGLDLDAVARKEVEPVFKPFVSEGEPAANFDLEFTTMAPQDSLATPVRPSADEFQGFSFAGMGMGESEITMVATEPSPLIG